MPLLNYIEFAGIHQQTFISLISSSTNSVYKSSIVITGPHRKKRVSHLTD